MELCCLHPRTVLFPLPTSHMTMDDFVALYINVSLAGHHMGSPALDCLSSTTCHPCYPGESHTAFPFFLFCASFGFPSATMRSALPINLRGYISVHFRCGLLFCRKEITTPDCSDAAPSCYRGEWIIPPTGLQPARQTIVTANGHPLKGPREKTPHH